MTLGRSFFQKVISSRRVKLWEIPFIRVNSSPSVGLYSRTRFALQYTFRKLEGKIFNSVRYLATVRRAMTIPFSLSIFTTS